MILFSFNIVSAGDMEEEHKKAKEGGYEKEYEDSLDKYGGTRTKEEHKEHHEREKQEKKQEKQDEYGKEWKDEQLK
jgi:hypothetical protein